MRQPVLIIVHQQHSNPGRVGEMLAGARLPRSTGAAPTCSTRCPRASSATPAAVVFGGPQSANDDDRPGVRLELAWLERVALPSGKPLLGICLGAQMMARVLGARVGRHPENLVEIGYHPIYPTAAGAAYFEGPTMFYQWHKETFEIPSGAVHLAHNDAFDSADVPLGRARLRHRVPPRDDARDDRALVGLGARLGDARAARRPAARGPSRGLSSATAAPPTAGSRASSTSTSCRRRGGRRRVASAAAITVRRRRSRRRRSSSRACDQPFSQSSEPRTSEALGLSARPRPAP